MAIFTELTLLKQIFKGCFQRVEDTELLSTQILSYLGSRIDLSCKSRLTPTSASNLAICVKKLTEAFIASKITLTSQVIALCANGDKAGGIHEVSRLNAIILCRLWIIYSYRYFNAAPQHLVYQTSLSSRKTPKRAKLHF